jgi:hypothetical protein
MIEASGRHISSRAIAPRDAFRRPSVVAGLKSHWLNWTREMMTYDRECLRLRRNGPRRRLYQTAQLFNSRAARYQMVGRLFGKPRWGELAPAEIIRWLESLGLGSMIVPARPRAGNRFDSSADRGQVETLSTGVGDAIFPS